MAAEGELGLENETDAQINHTDIKSVGHFVTRFFCQETDFVILCDAFLE